MHLNDIVFSENQTGFVVGDNGTMLKTTNRGQSSGINWNY